MPAAPTFLSLLGFSGLSCIPVCSRNRELARPSVCFYLAAAGLVCRSKSILMLIKKKRAQNHEHLSRQLHSRRAASETAWTSESKEPDSSTILATRPTQAWISSWTLWVSETTELSWQVNDIIKAGKPGTDFRKPYPESQLKSYDK